MAVLLVRHAEAGDRHRWKGSDELRPLSDEGEAQAADLVGMLAGFDVRRVLSSPYLRCTQSVAPLARARGVEVERSPELAEGAGTEALGLVRGLLEGPDTVLCTHGDVVEDVLDGLGVRRSGETEKGATWVLAAGTARPLPPPA